MELYRPLPKLRAHAHPSPRLPFTRLPAENLGGRTGGNPGVGADRGEFVRVLSQMGQMSFQKLRRSLPNVGDHPLLVVRLHILLFDAQGPLRTLAETGAEPVAEALLAKPPLPA